MTNNDQLTPVAQDIVPKLRRKNRIEGRSRALTLSIATALVVVFVGLIYLLAHAEASDTVDRQLQQANRDRQADITSIQDQLKNVCRKVSDPAKLTPQEREGCFRAENSIPPAPVTVTQVPPSGSGPTTQQVQAMIAAALAQAPRPLTVEQVTATAQLVFAQQAPSLVTPQKIGDAVASFCAGDACRGPAGKNGIDGKDALPVTSEQIQEQVAAYCALPENHGCTGPQGVSVVGFDDPGPKRSRLDSNQPPCVIVAHLIDPETSRTSTQDITVPVEFCYTPISAPAAKVTPSRR